MWSREQTVITICLKDGLELVCVFVHVNSFPIHVPKFSHCIHYWAFKYVTRFSEVLTTQISGDFSASCDYSESEQNHPVQFSF